MRQLGGEVQGWNLQRFRNLQGSATSRRPNRSAICKPSGTASPTPPSGIRLAPPAGDREGSEVLGSALRAYSARGSRGSEGDADNIGRRFPMFQSIGENAQRQSFHSGEGLLPSHPVCHNTWQIRNLRDPAPVCLLL